MQYIPLLEILRLVRTAGVVGLIVPIIIVVIDGDDCTVVVLAGVLVVELFTGEITFQDKE